MRLCILSESLLITVILSAVRIRADSLPTPAIPQSAAVKNSTPSPTPTAIARPPFLIRELSDEKHLTLTDLADPHVRIPFTVENTSTKRLTAFLHATPFLAASVDPVQSSLLRDTKNGSSQLPSAQPDDSGVRWIPGGSSRLQLEPRELAVIIVAAFLPIAASYHATLQLCYKPCARQRRSFSFLVTVIRTNDKQQFEVKEPPATLARKPFFEALPTQCFHFKVTAKNSPLTLAAPLLLSSTYTTKADGTLATGTTLELRGEPKPIEIQADGPAAVDVTMGGFKGHGRYDFTFRFAARGYLPVDAKTTIYVQHHPFWAFAVLCLGLLVSLGVLVLLRRCDPTFQGRRRLVTASRLASEGKASEALRRFHGGELSIAQALTKLTEEERRNVDKKLTRQEIGVSVALAIAALVTGLWSLYSDSPTWGTARDYLAAFAAGFSSDFLSKIGMGKLWPRA